MIDIGANELNFSSDVGNLPKINKTVDENGNETDIKVKITSLPNSSFEELDTKEQYVRLEDLNLSEEELKTYEVNGVLPEFVNVSLIKDFNAEDWELETKTAVIVENKMFLKDSIPEIATAEKIFTSDVKDSLTAESTKSKSLVKALTEKTLTDDDFKLLKNFTIDKDFVILNNSINLSEMFTADYWKDVLSNMGSELLDELKSGLADLGKSLLDWATTPAHSKVGTDFILETNKNRDYSSPIQVLLARVPDMFSNMYDIWFSPTGEPSNFADEKNYVSSVEDWRIYSANIKGIDIPQPKRETFQRQACGMVVEVPKTEVSIQKVFTLSIPLDANYYLLDNYFVNKFQYINPVGTLREYFFKNSKHYDMVVKYKPYYGTASANFESDYSVTTKENGQTKTYNLTKSQEPYNAFDEDEASKINFVSTGSKDKNPTRYFIFKDVRCLGVVTNDLQYNNQAANTMDCQLKFTFRKVEEIDKNTLADWSFSE